MATSQSHAERRAAAAESFRIFFPAGEPERVAEGLARRQGALGAMAYDVVGAMWARPELSRRDRSVVVIAILISLGAVAELDVHFPAGLRHGLSRAELEEMVNHLSLYSGIPRAVEAMRALRAAFARLDEAT